MWLINTETLKLHEFFGDNIPSYAILSHRWEEDEINFKDYAKKRRTKSAGTVKVHKFCEVAAKAGHGWCWADTCCIDKRSSAELSEAINSMFEWYRKAKNCYAYLSDIDLPKTNARLTGEQRRSLLAQSEWFQRGWTLQELIAPKDIIFLDRSWSKIGQKSMMIEILSHITQIDLRALKYPWVLAEYSVATKMSWASKRKTTRAEDMAYSLLGIFDVNMPLLYGEGGQKAFERLQKTLLQETSDMSVFLWKSFSGNIASSLFAPSPRYFLGLHGLLYKSRMPTQAFCDYVNFLRLKTAYSLTNDRLEIRACLLPKTAYNLPSNFSKSEYSFLIEKHSRVLLTSTLQIVQTGEMPKEPAFVAVLIVESRESTSVTRGTKVTLDVYDWSDLYMLVKRQDLEKWVDELELITITFNVRSCRKILQTWTPAFEEDSILNLRNKETNGLKKK